MNNYPARWRLAMALKQPYPRETGDVMTTDPATTSSSSGSGFSLSPADIKIALQNMSKAAWLAIGLGAIVGGAVGYALGRKKSQ
jgi:hypothetical protein